MKMLLIGLAVVVLLVLVLGGSLVGSRNELVVEKNAVDGAWAQVDVALLWECAGPEEQLFDDLAHEFYGHSPSPLEATAMLLALWGAPLHFHKKARGHFKAATADQLPNQPPVHRAAIAHIA